MSSVLNYAAAREVFADAQAGQYALPAVNVISTNTINATLEAARLAGSPVIIQLSHGGSHFFAGKSLSNDRHQASMRGAIAAASHVHEVSELYGVPVLLNTDHAAMKLLPWVDGLIARGEDHFRQHGKPLFTSHMIDLSEEPLHKNIEISKRYLEKLTHLDMYLEIELGITGGEEDGVDNTEAEHHRLYTQPEEVAYAYEQLMQVSDHFIIAAAFGNVHGVYAPGNVKLEPLILKRSQQYVQQKFGTGPNPVKFVFHGGSGSSPEDIREAVSHGVVKFNIDTDVQWSFWDGVHRYYTHNRPYLASQIGNPQGKDSPNKKYYDPRTWLREGEISIADRLSKAYDELNASARKPLRTML
jgi:fructose-bisphosphate aldolase, class II